jgi:hypothetical protein
MPAEPVGNEQDATFKDEVVGVRVGSGTPVVSATERANPQGRRRTDHHGPTCCDEHDVQRTRDLTACNRAASTDARRVTRLCSTALQDLDVRTRRGGRGLRGFSCDSSPLSIVKTNSVDPS